MTAEEIINLLKVHRTFKQVALEKKVTCGTIRRILSKERRLDEAFSLLKYKHNPELRKQRTIQYMEKVNEQKAK